MSIFEKYSRVVEFMRLIYKHLSILSRYIRYFIWKWSWLVIASCLILVACGTPSQHPAPVQVLQCGTIDPGSVNTFAVEKVGTCFWEAYQKCQIASLVYIDEKSNQYSLMTKASASRCEVRETVRLAHETKLSIYICSQLEGFRGGSGALVLSDCTSHSNMLIPVNFSIQ